jgi:hypothetical protein
MEDLCKSVHEEFDDLKGCRLYIKVKFHFNFYNNKK